MKKRVVCVLLACLLLMTTVFAAPAEKKTGFEDVPEGYWAEDAISRCVDHGFFLGESAETFGVGKPMTRSAFAVVLSRFFAWDTSAPYGGIYPDVAADAWYAGALQAAYDHGAVTRQSGSFRPSDPITREELAVMLVRALGYGNIAGLAQEDAVPFTDVTTNAGYIAMAYELGLVNGTDSTSFSPDRYATREQAAVLLMRLYDKYYAQNPQTIGVVTSEEELPALEGVETVALQAYQLAGAQLKSTLTVESEAALKETLMAEERTVLLGVAGEKSLTSGQAKAAAELVAQAVTAGGFDGVYLDLQATDSAAQAARDQMAALLREALGEAYLYVTADAPLRGADLADYTALAAAADKIVLQFPGQLRSVSGVNTATLEIPEEIYYALSALNDTVEPGKLCLQLTGTGLVCRGSRLGERWNGSRIVAEVEKGTATVRYHSSYACAYLQNSALGSHAALWYLNGEGLAVRQQLLRCFGVNQICFDNLNGILPELLPA